jgi:hypothetical protein
VLAELDLSGPFGPIEQQRVQWYVGSDVAQRIVSDFASDPTMPLPAVRTGETSPVLRAIETAMLGIAGVDRANQQTIADYYGQLESAMLLDRLQSRLDAPPPRVLLITSRFTSVLQYSTRDTADAFEKLGWETKVLIEPKRWHAVARPAVHSAIASFKPDLIFQIDHLRYEHGSAVPSNIPFVCWIQDHLPNLVSEEAGRSMGSHDFVLTANPSVYADRYGYPKQSLIAVHKLTRVPARPDRWDNSGEDVVFVSTASRTGPQLLEHNLSLVNCNPAQREAFKRAQQQLIDAYDAGQSFGVATELASILDRHLSGIASDAATREAMLRLMVHPLNDALYRQQSIDWLIDIAKPRNLKIGLYGRGWDGNPRFAPYARGPVQYGGPLEELTRASKINLQITPNACLHQRLLDGLVAGGFFLVREHVTDQLLTRLARFVTQHLPPDVERIEQARAAIDVGHRVAFEQLMAECQPIMSVLGESCDPVAQIRAVIEAQSFDENLELIPRLADVSFNSRATMERAIDRFLADESLRREVAREQRYSIESRRTYQAGISQMLTTIRQRLTQSAGEGQDENQLRHRDLQSGRSAA